MSDARGKTVDAKELVQIPFYVESSTLPAPLPSKEEIKNSPSIAQWPVPSRDIVAVGPHFIVKYGRDIDLIEGQNLLFVRRATNVPVPRLLAMFVDEETNEKYLIMERVPGERLDLAWPSMTKDQKAAVAAKVKRIVDEMRAVQSPAGYCSVGVTPLTAGAFCTSPQMHCPRIDGPFATEGELNEAMVNKYIFSNGSKIRAEHYRRAFSAVFSNCPPIFTHGDIQGKNILVRRRSDSPTDEENNNTDYDVTLIDWESAGWYPTYWEYAMAMMAAGRWDNDWGLWLDEMMVPYYNESAWVERIYLQIWL